MSETALHCIAGRNSRRNTSPSRNAQGTIVLLHEALGSVSHWRDFPEQLAERCEMDVLLYSRLGHGQSEGPPACAQPPLLSTSVAGSVARAARPFRHAAARAARTQRRRGHRAHLCSDASGEGARTGAGVAHPPCRAGLCRRHGYGRAGVARDRLPRTPCASSPRSGCRLRCLAQHPRLRQPALPCHSKPICLRSAVRCSCCKATQTNTQPISRPTPCAASRPRCIWSSCPTPAIPRIASSRRLCWSTSKAFFAPFRQGPPGRISFPTSQ